jgi:hypothetical protein
VVQNKCNNCKYISKVLRCPLCSPWLRQVTRNIFNARFLCNKYVILRNRMKETSCINTSTIKHLVQKMACYSWWHVVSQMCGESSYLKDTASLSDLCPSVTRMSLFRAVLSTSTCCTKTLVTFRFNHTFYNTDRTEFNVVLYQSVKHPSLYAFKSFFFVKGPAADATDAPQP